jgi:hypothetical protein
VRTWSFWPIRSPVTVEQVLRRLCWLVPELEEDVADNHSGGFRGAARRHPHDEQPPFATLCSLRARQLHWAEPRRRRILWMFPMSGPGARRSTRLRRNRHAKSANDGEPW